MKRFQHTKRNGKSLFSELVLPALFVCMSLAVTSVFPTLQERPPLEVEPWLYPSPRYIFYSNDNPESLQMEKYISEVKGPEGLGSLCILIDGKRNSDCLSPVDIKWSNFLKKSKNVTIVECSCSTGAQVCPASIGNSEPSYTKVRLCLISLYSS
ncbi:hypothetical protein AAG570_001269 [Ranatra chinensis]|uniref:Uncharacterized protein n=1 Tax=Ranatra chinensis TaxID=642074 RepID=A0ABD0YBD6_9HEMI